MCYKSNESRGHPMMSHKVPAMYNITFNVRPVALLKEHLHTIEQKHHIPHQHKLKHFKQVMFNSVMKLDAEGGRGGSPLSRSTGQTLG